MADNKHSNQKRKPGLAVVIALTPADRARRAADAEAEMTGRPQPFGGRYDQAGPDADTAGAGVAGTGTAAAGYMPPEEGPFRCDHCVYFKAGNAGPADGGAGSGDDAAGRCANPAVRRDPEVRGNVQAGGCCSFFEPEGGPANAGAMGGEAGTEDDNDGGPYQQAA